MGFLVIHLFLNSLFQIWFNSRAMEKIKEALLAQGRTYCSVKRQDILPIKENYNLISGHPYLITSILKQSSTSLLFAGMKPKFPNHINSRDNVDHRILNSTQPCLNMHIRFRLFFSCILSCI